MNSLSWYCTHTVATWKTAPCYVSDNEGIKRHQYLPKNEWSNVSQRHSIRQANNKAFWSRRFLDVHTLCSVFGCESSLPRVQIKRFFICFYLSCLWYFFFFFVCCMGLLSQGLFAWKHIKQKMATHCVLAVPLHDDGILGAWNLLKLGSIVKSFENPTPTVNWKK